MCGRGSFALLDALLDARVDALQPLSALAAVRLVHRARWLLNRRSQEDQNYVSVCSLEPQRLTLQKIEKAAAG